ncbi:sorting nexin family protein [Abortiporus biennis]
MVLGFSKNGFLVLISVGLILPAITHVLSSPFILILLSPLIFLLFVLGFLFLNLLCGYLLDLTRSPVTNQLPHAARPFAFSTPAAWQAVLTRSQWSYKAPQTLAPLAPEYPVISAALNDILIMIVRDFVLTWYRDISSSPSFPTSVSTTIHGSLQRLLARSNNIDLSALMVKKVLPQVTAHIEQFRQSEVALRGAGLERRLTQSEELDLLLASRYASRGGSGGKLHTAIENLSSTFTKQSEEAHLRELVDKALPYILPEIEGKSKALKIVVREVVACTVLYPVMEMLTDPDFWNRSIDQVAGEAIRQQRLISKVRNVLEAQLPRPHPRVSESLGPATRTDTTITIRTDPRQFESFLRSINRCSSLLDARRLKNDIMGEIRRTRTLLASHEKEDWINGEKTEDIVAFLDRLYTAKRKVEKRIAVLGGESDVRSAPSSYNETDSNPRLTLRDVLTNPTSLSYFMEFMDRRHRSLPVQFWLTVESFKNPLESVDSESSDDDDETLRDPSLSANLKEDISMINELYFANPTPDPVLSAISQKHVNTIKSFGIRSENEAPSPAAERRVRRSVMLAQRQVEREVEQQDFEEFQRSELWFRVLGDTQSNIRRVDADFFNERRSVEHTEVEDHSGVNKPMPYHLFGSTPTLTPPHIQGPYQKRDLSSRSTINLPGTTPGSLPPSATASRTSPSNLELLMSPASDAPSSSRAPLFDDPEDAKINAAIEAQSQRMEAIQAALTDIIALDNQGEDHHNRETSEPMASSTASLFPTSTIDDTHPEVASDEEGPGDLQLSYEIERLGTKISHLQTQDTMLDTLIKKAELTGDAQELKLLRRSKSSLTREVRELNFQRTQYEQQESANRLVSDRTKITIVNSTVGEEEGKSVVRYLIEIQQLASDGGYASGWVVARRYNEFFNMHNKLRDKYALVRNLDFPGKRLVTSLSGSFVDSRRIALEKYMQSLIAIPAVCESEELRVFLSRDSPFMASVPSNTRSSTSSGAFPGKNLVRTVYQSVAESIDDMFFGPSMLDVIIQRLTTQAAEFAGIVGSGVHDEDLVAQALKASGKTTAEDSLLQLPGDLKPLEGETSTSSFTSPICDLILAVFELDKKNNWLRRQAIVIILQQVLGTTIERKLRETVKGMLDESHLMSYINIFRDGMWPKGQLKPSGVPRTAEEKLRTRDEANRKLSALIPDLAANMIGRSNARRGARRIFAVLQNRRLNQHLVYTIVDEVFATLFPEAALKTSPPPS